MDNCTELVFQYSGDIAGVGVRVSFYVQNFILVLLVARSHEDAESSLWTFIATSFGLIVAALVQVGLGPGSLSLLEGILVSQLTWLANLGTFLSLASYSRSKGKDNAIKFAAVCQGYLSMILTIVIFFVFFGVDVPALGSGKIIALVFASLTIVVYSAITFTECMAWKRHGMSHWHVPLRDTPQDADIELASIGGHHTRQGTQASGHPSSHRHLSVETSRGANGKLVPNASGTRHPRRGTQASEHTKHTSSHRRTRSGASQVHRHHPRHPSRQQWLGTDVDPVFFGIFLAQIVIFAYFISTTEKIVNQKNASVSGGTQWGFGQVLALVVVIPAVIALVRAMRKNRIAKLKKEKEQREDEGLRVPASPRVGESSDSTTPNPPNLQLHVSIPSSSTLDPSQRNGLAPESRLLGPGSSISSSPISDIP